MRVVIRSRAGNVVLGILGVLYVIAGAATLIYYVATNWGANHLIDYALQAALVASVVGGGFFVAIAEGNLKFLQTGDARKSPPLADTRTAAAARS